MMLRFCQNRWEFAAEIEHILSSGTTIVCDRYAYSSVAYSCAKGLDMEQCKLGDVGLPAPDVVIVLVIDPEEAARRGSQYGNERYENIEFQKKGSFRKLIFQFRKSLT